MSLWLIITIFLLTSVLIAGAFLLKRYIDRKETESTPEETDEKPLQKDACAYLVMLSVDALPPVLLQFNITSIGRNDDNDVTIKDPSVSRHHAQIYKDHPGKYSIKDLNSLNGIYINDKPVKKANLKEGDKIELGDIRCRFTFTAEAMPESTLPETAQLKSGSGNE